MHFHRIHITGASGSGTTTLGAALADRLGYKFCDADDFFWERTTPPFKIKRLKEERLRMLHAELVDAPGFVLSGSICGWNLALEDSFDLIVFLYLPQEIRLSRLRERELTLHGLIDEDFLVWAAGYDEGDLSQRSRKLHEQWLARRRCQILRLEHNMTLEERLAAVLNH